MQHRRKSRKGGSHSTLSLLRKELREGNLQSLFGGSSCIVSSSNSAPDPLLSSFILPMVDDFVSVQPHLSSETSTTKKSSDANKSERQVIFCCSIFEPYTVIFRRFFRFVILIFGFDSRHVQSSPLSVKDQEEKAKRCDFVQGLLLSTILDDVL
ncbi:Protein dehydration-induced 19 [Theobroma cacao]|nr:Protein dehydration-induced 19 [Theobroma cacao]